MRDIVGYPWLVADYLSLVSGRELRNFFPGEPAAGCGLMAAPTEEIFQRITVTLKKVAGMDVVFLFVLLF